MPGLPGLVRLTISLVVGTCWELKNENRKTDENSHDFLEATGITGIYWYHWYHRSGA